VLLVAAFWALSCGGDHAFDENVDISVCDPSQGGFSLNINNPYFPLVPGSRLVLDGDDNGTALHLEITVLDSTVDVAGVTTRILEERETEGGELVEVSRNFFVQASDGSVCYYGEDVDIYQGGVIVAHSGQWRAGEAGARPGIMMPASPAPGMTFRQEIAPGVAEDRAEIRAVGETVTVPAGTFVATVRFLETTPLEPGSTTVKVFAEGVGLIVDDVLRLTGRSP
jgi:hypothetical protein